MLTLATENDTIELLLADVVVSDQLEWSAHFVDLTATTHVPGNDHGQSTDLTPVTVVDSPVASTYRKVDHLSVYNADTAAAQATIRYNFNGTTRVILKYSIPAGATLSYESEHLWQLIESDGTITNF